MCIFIPPYFFPYLQSSELFFCINAELIIKYFRLACNVFETIHDTYISLSPSPTPNSAAYKFILQQHHHSLALPPPWDQPLRKRGASFNIHSQQSAGEIMLMSTNPSAHITTVFKATKDGA